MKTSISGKIVGKVRGEIGWFQGEEFRLFEFKLFEVTAFADMVIVFHMQIAKFCICLYWDRF